MLVKNGEGMKEYTVIQNGVGEILKVNKFGPDETANRCKMVAELCLEPGQCTGLHAHTTNVELFYIPPLLPTRKISCQFLSLRHFPASLVLYGKKGFLYQTN